MTLPTERTAREEAAAMAALEANDAMMEAALSCSRQACRRAAEEWSSEWLGSPQSFSSDPQENPVLAALLHPDGAHGVRGFDEFFGDLRSWTFGPWPAVQWAVAARSETALAWALEGGQAHDELTRREEKPQGSDKPRRNAIGLAAQIGDADWLARVLTLACEQGARLKDLAKTDRLGEPTALGLALFEWAQALAAGDHARAEGLRSCSELLASKGFLADSPRMPAAKLACALSAKMPAAETLLTRPAIQRAARLSALAGGVFSQAGSRLDLAWADNLRLCGFKESKKDRFGLAASHALLTELLTPERSAASELKNFRPELRQRLALSIEASLAALPVIDRPLRGFEFEAIETFGSGDWDARARLAHKVALARELAAPSPSAKTTPRL